MVWVNTESGKPGTRWYGKTKQGKYMTEADAIKAGYHPQERMSSVSATKKLGTETLPASFCQGHLYLKSAFLMLISRAR